MRLDVDRAIEELVRSAEQQGSTVHGVWVFGSCARGEAGPESDIDLGILCDPPLGLDVTALIDRLGRTLGVEIDVIDLATTSATLAWEIVTSGRLALERDERSVETFLQSARHAAEDEAQRNRMIVLAQAPRIGAQSS